MSQATWPASAMIFLNGGSAMKPFLASSKSRLSSKGSVAVTPLRNSIVNVDGRLPFGSKCLTCAVGAPTAAPWACAAGATQTATAVAKTRACCFENRIVSS